MSRKLASIQRISAIEPIAGADRIELLRVLGWQTIAKKGEFKVNDLCCFLEVDSVPQDTPAFAFLWQKPEATEPTPRPGNFKLRTKRLRGVLSQGLAMPLSVLPEGTEVTEGSDVTAVLGITKWEPIQGAAREIECGFPTMFFPKTDEIRVQSVPDVLAELRGVNCYTTLKCDGQSVTFAKYLDGGVETKRVCTRNWAVKDVEGSPHWGMARTLQIFERMPMGFAVQGELVGPQIQANRMGLPNRQFLAFQVFEVSRQRFLDFHQFKEFCTEYGIPMVPVLTVAPLAYTLEELLAAADGVYENGHPREGIVIRPTIELNSQAIAAYEGSMHARASFKAISNNFLIKIGE